MELGDSDVLKEKLPDASYLKAVIIMDGSNRYSSPSIRTGYRIKSAAMTRAIIQLFRLTIMMSKISVDDTHWNQAVKRFGSATVAHLLDLPINVQPDPTDVRRREVLEQLAVSWGDEPMSGEQRISFLCFRLAIILPGHNRTFVEGVRHYLGGWLPRKTGDELVDSLVRLVFNGLAMEKIPGADKDRISISAAFQDPRLCTPAAEAFLKDPELTKLFPGAKQEPDEQGRIRAFSLLLWLPAGGGTIDLSILIGNFVEQTLARMRFAEQLTEDHIEDYVVDSLEQLRKLARGEEVDILVMTGLVGIETIDSLDCGTWGIRPAQGLAISQIPFSESEYQRPKSVLWMRVPHRLLARHRADIDEEEANKLFEELSDQHKVFHSQLRREVLTIQFGLLAWAVEEEKHHAVNAQATASWSLLPLASAQPPWTYEPPVQRGVIAMKLDALKMVARVVDELGALTDRLDIALTRMVRVASEDRRPADALIDAVIAWENMLGSKSETTFKVSAALSWLLEPEDLEARRTLNARAKKIYNLRSRIVHGEVDDDMAEAAKFSKEALTLAVRVFRHIHAQPKLKDMSSSARAEMILLGCDS